MKKIFILFIILIFPLTVHAKDDFNIDCNRFELKEFEDFTCRTSVNSTFEFDKISFEIDLSKGIFLEEVRSNFTNLWSVKINKNIITAETKNKELVSGLQEFGIFLLNTTEFGVQNINIKNITLINSNENTKNYIENVNKKIIIMSSENKLKNIFIDNKKLPKFNSEVFSYIINIKSDVTKVNLSADSYDEKAIIKNIGDIEIEKKSKTTIIPIIITSESGVNRIYNLFFVKEDQKDVDIMANSIELTDNNKNIIEYKFNPEKYEYNLEVDPKITSIKFGTILENKKDSLLKDFGNREVDINDGDNTVLIKIKNQDGDIKTYVFNITKLLSNKSANRYLKSLVIDNYKIKFNKRVKNYYLGIKKSTKKLNITTLAEDKKTIVNIIGNEDLTEGSIIKIIVKAENGSKNTYQIEITHQKSDILLYILSAVLSFFTLTVINNFIKMKNVKLESISAKTKKDVKINKPSKVKSKSESNKNAKVKYESKNSDKFKKSRTTKEEPKDTKVKPKSKVNQKSNTKKNVKTSNEKSNVKKVDNQPKINKKNSKPKNKKNIPKKKSKKKK